MYNRGKRITSLIAGILCMVLGIYSCFLGFLSFIFAIECTAGFLLQIPFFVGLGVPIIIFGNKVRKMPERIGDYWDDRKSLHVKITVLLSLFMVFSLVAGLVCLVKYIDVLTYVDDLYYGSSFRVGTAIALYSMAITHLSNSIYVIYPLALNVVSMCLRAQKGPLPPVAPSAQPQSPYVFEEYGQRPQQDQDAQGAPQYLPCQSEQSAPVCPSPASQPTGEDVPLEAKAQRLKEWKEAGYITQEQYDEAIKDLIKNM